MLTEYEAQKLARDYRQELNATSGAVLKCAVGLLVVVALALFRPGIDLQRDAAGDTASAATRAAMQQHQASE